MAHTFVGPAEDGPYHGQTIEGPPGKATVPAYRNEVQVGEYNYNSLVEAWLYREFEQNGEAA